MLTLKVNPAHFSKSPRDILKYFPNINTMVVSKFESLKDTIALPDTVTSIVAKNIGFGHLTESTIRYADRVVEIGDGDSPRRTQRICHRSLGSKRSYPSSNSLIQRSRRTPSS